ncbi:hypothetical protein [Tsukamurella ocularis]|uniref:hypothetical protein n=1 Tax=Tsukamurella ocularis TaxID=1970234 RepID=UPI0021694E4B|nr:hypothetical protein [Tsukamurella ocularis]MCS3779905.1 thiosulfate dehydrogenase [quinone] large subunit [Tsukamurella ocularis]MCS3788695.1 thiosulfate dehydrogenase [quinone] large subunit [Tsukamurella ocularis]MCS3849905.1 thiosulfate dehydrogenase [quinone] large subunit [Tsukamurella ocularis]
MTPFAIRAATVAVVAARIALGAAWLHEGYVKYHAGFGRSDILLVVGSATGNPRVPGSFAWFATEVMGRFAAVFGILVPLTEVALGVAALIGLVPRATAFVATGLLGFYWAADQLVMQYPVMVVLAATVLAGGELARRWTPTAALSSRLRGRGRGRAPARSA